MRSGILTIDKPQNMTSFDVVAILRRVLGTKKIGHLGTLDPMAEGVLPIAVGKAARIMEYLDADLKEYVCTARFGLRTDTLDIWGETLEEADTAFLTRERTEEALLGFRGTGEQVPPMYSALKVNGRKLYEYARAGKTLDLPSRPVAFPEIELMGFTPAKEDTPAEATFRVVCTKGTYIRSLVRDLGEALGCGAAMSRLVRTASGVFWQHMAIPAMALKTMTAAELEERMMPIETALNDFGWAETGGDWETRLFTNGVALRADQWRVRNAPRFEKSDFYLPLKPMLRHAYRVRSPEGVFLGVGIEGEDGGLTADKIFLEQET